VARWDNRCENASPTGSAENEIPMEIKYPGLALLKYEHPIHISGTISDISEHFSLKDVKIKFNL
jgi:hypothetical protein